SKEVAGDAFERHALDATEIDQVVGERRSNRFAQRPGRVLEVHAVQTAHLPECLSAMTAAQSDTKLTKEVAGGAQGLFLLARRCQLRGAPPAAVLGQKDTAPQAGLETLMLHDQL